jgi:DNA-binding GntR family transcriptional regulator
MSGISLERIERESVTEKTVALLRQKILSGNLKPGTRLVEADIAAQLGTSRAPVREAFLVLEPEGLLHSESTKGTFVAEIQADDLRELYILRSVLEGLAMRLAVPQIGGDQLTQLSSIVQRMQKAARERNIEEVIQLDLEFHEQIWRFSGHRRLQEILHNMLTPIRLFLAVNTQVYGDLVDNVLEHTELVQALASHDAKQAEQVMINHIEEAGEKNIQYLTRLKTADQ